MTIRPVHLWGRTMLFGGGALTSLLMGWTGSGTLHAQPGSGTSPAYTQSAPQVPRNYLNKNIIQLPIQIDAASRTKIQLDEGRALELAKSALSELTE